MRTAMRLAPGTVSCNSCNCLEAKCSGTSDATPVMLPPGLARLATSPTADRVAHARHHDRNRGGRRLECKVGTCSARGDHVRLPGHQLARDFGEPVWLAVRITALDDEVLPLHVAAPAQFFEERQRVRVLRADAAVVEHADAIDPAGLGTRREGRGQRDSAGAGDHAASIKH